MIVIENKSDCCGCSACISICPLSCISMTVDEEGFLYPRVNLNICIDCKLCEKVCLVLNPLEERKEIAVYAVKNKDKEIIKQSSSGGVFTLLANRVIERGGVVFGAKFNENWQVIHDFAETLEGISVFRSSKYVQSVLGDCFMQVKSFLDSGRLVLFCGAPCQIAGLKMFLNKDYSNLLLVDFICHGVPSPLVWKRYLNEKITNYNSTISNISFRDKKYGWKIFGLAIDFKNKNGKISKQFYERYYKNLYMRGFLENLFLRPSCHKCPAKSLKSGSDITIADFWGIKKIAPDVADDNGVSLVMINTHLGNDYYSEINKIDKQINNYTLQKVLFNSTKQHKQRAHFFNLVQNENLSIESAIKRVLDKKSKIENINIDLLYYKSMIFSILKK